MKFLPKNLRERHDASRPSRGAWVEIPCQSVDCLRRSVAPLAGRVG